MLAATDNTLAVFLKMEDMSFWAHYHFFPILFPHPHSYKVNDYQFSSSSVSLHFSFLSVAYIAMPTLYHASHQQQQQHL